MREQPLSSESLEHFLLRAEQVLMRLEQCLPELPKPLDWSKVRALRWHKSQGQGHLQAIEHLSQLRLVDLRQIDAQKAVLIRNTEQFLQGKPANNVLMTGARGTGKSSLLKALLNDYAHQGLRLIEVDKQDLAALPDIVRIIHGRPERFILSCDDLSFDEGEPGYKALKSLLDGSLSVVGDNLLIYATSNRRHLMPEYFQDNLQAKYQPSGEIHPGEAIEEKVSLSDRFGIWISFYPFSQEEYLKIVDYCLAYLGSTSSAAAHRDALQWALTRGSRSGRVAWQFAKDWVGQHA